LVEKPTLLQIQSNVHGIELFRAMNEVEKEEFINYYRYLHHQLLNSSPSQRPTTPVQQMFVFSFF
jgi:hypothetical protein